MVSLLSYKAIDTVSSGVSMPAIIILSVAVSISTFNAYIRSSVSYYRSSSSLITLLISSIAYITGLRAIELPYISIP